MDSDGRLKIGKAFTLVELLVVIAIISILAAMVMTSVNRARATAYSASCINNLRQLGIAVQLYADSNDEFYPYPSASYSGPDKNPELCWFNALDPYLLGGPAATGKTTEKLHLVKQDPIIKTLSEVWLRDAHTIKMNQRLGEDSSGNHLFYRLSSLSNPANTVLMFDGRAETEKTAAGAPSTLAKNPQGTEGMVSRRHRGRANVLFADIHVESRIEKSQKSGGLGWAIDETRLLWKPWQETIPVAGQRQ
jgi:prepilin-type N-terminal cleavage/methylation domain-containing protein/prepilin-type processing-associated H-X9-DG protein